MRLWFFYLLLLSGVVCAACSAGTTTSTQSKNQSLPSPNPGRLSENAVTRIASSLPNNGFKALLAINDAPRKMRAGEQADLRVHVKNASDVNWPALGEADGRYAITLRNRWLTAGTTKVINDIDGGTSLPHDLAAGAEIVLPLKVTAPRKAGDYDLEVDMVQERVSFFGEKGSQPAKVALKVE